MTFPMASRFSDYLAICSPSPNPYKAPAPNSSDENSRSSISARHYSSSAHKCDNNCFLDGHCKRLRDVHDSFLKKSANSKRQSLEPRPTNFRGKNGTNATKADDKMQARVLRRQSLNFQSPENKENLPLTPTKRKISSIPRFRKTVTEGQAPSFLTRPRNIHDCLNNIDEVDHLSSNFIRNSPNRKSIKVKKTDENNIQLVRRPFNVSYTVLPRVEESSSSARLNQSENVEASSTEKMLKNMTNIIKDMKGINWKGQVLTKPKLTNDNFDNDKSPRVVKKSLELENELLIEKCEIPKVSDKINHENVANQEVEESNKIDMEKSNTVEKSNIETNDKSNISTSIASQENEDGLRSHDIFALQDCNLILLINEEFIDDEYDSYIQGLNTSKGHLQVLQNNELYEMTSSLVRVYLQTNTVPANPIGLLEANGSSTMQKVKGKIGKYLNKRMRKKKTKKENNWSEVARIVRAAIEGLKGEFRREILDKTNEKIDQLVSELKNVTFKANEDIETTCETATVNLLSRLENFALKSKC